MIEKSKTTGRNKVNCDYCLDITVFKYQKIVVNNYRMLKREEAEMKYVGNILYDDKLLSSNNGFVIFGSGVFGRKVFEYLELNGMKDKVICFCDSDERLEGSEIEGISVRLAREVLASFPAADYLISGRYVKEMYQVLKQENIDRIHIFIP